jgi:hypothetical protein
MLFNLYLRKGKVFVPTCGRVPGGPYRDIEPVTVVEVSDIDSLRQAWSKFPISTACGKHFARRSRGEIRQ